ncbi:MAG: carbon starvation protein A [Bacteroidales bacterium]|nr:carbon starvation protein A [Bacteroidales bacterium]
MYSFIISICALVLGYLLYGKFVDKVFGPVPSRITPAISKQNGVDFVVMPSWKVYMIQFLNIAGTGPIFGAIMGAKFGPASYLWIVLGSIFAGGVHDYFSGMLSIRHGGATLPEIVSAYLGKRTRRLMLGFSIILLLLVGTVFVYSPAIILGDLAGNGTDMAVLSWVIAIFIYYILATLLPVDKLIGKLYPIFAFCMMFMAVALMICLFVKWPSLPELWEGLGNKGAEQGLSGMSSQPIFPCLFITIACGALSGFHSTQSPIMARCVSNEKMGRPIFYGAMITEGFVALIWAAVSSYFFFDGGAAQVGSDLSASAPKVVTSVSTAWLGVLGGILAIIGVVAAPITSGDTAFRSARLILGDFLHIDQKPTRNRLRIAIPIFILNTFLLWFNISHEDGFNTIWRYFGWANQILACFTLWTATVYLTINKNGVYYLIALIPAAFMNGICMAYFFVDKSGMDLHEEFALPVAILTSIISLALFWFWRLKKFYKKFNRK